MKVTLIISWFLLLTTNPSLLAQFAGLSIHDDKEGLHKINTSKIFKTTTGDYWLASNGNGMYKYVNDMWENIEASEDKLLNGWIVDIDEDSLGGVWFRHAYNEGTTRFYNGEFEQYLFKDQIRNEKKDNQKLIPTSSHKISFSYDNFKTPFSFAKNGKKLEICIFDYEKNEFVVIPSASFDVDSLETAGFNLSHCAIVYDNTLNEFVVTEKKGERILMYSQSKGKVILRACDDRYKIRLHLGGDTLVILNLTNEALSIQVENCSILKKGISPKFINFPTPSEYDLHFVNIVRNKSIQSKTKYLSSWKMESNLKNLSKLVICKHDETVEIEDCIIIDDAVRIANPCEIDGSIFYAKNGQLKRHHPEFVFVPIRYESLNENTWSANQLENGKLIFSSYDGGLLEYDGFNISKLDTKFDEYSRWLDGSYKNTSGDIFLNSSRAFSNQAKYINGIIKIDSNYNRQTLAEGQVGFFLSENNDGELMYGTSKNGLWILPEDKEGNGQDDWIKIDQKKGLDLLNVLTATQDQNGHYWMGRGSQGLAMYSSLTDTVYNWLRLDDAKHKGVQSMDLDSSGNLWLGTETGLYLVEDIHNKIFNNDVSVWTFAKQIASEYTGTSMVEICKNYNNDYLVIGNAKGLFFLDLNNWNKNNKLIIHSFTESNGFNGGPLVQNAVFFDSKKNIWTIGTKGAVGFNPTSLDNLSFAVTIHLDSITTNENSFVLKKPEVELGALERSFKIHCSINTVDKNDNEIHSILSDHFLRYRLDNSENWSPMIKAGYVEFHNLDPGTYTLELIGERNGIQSTPQFIEIKINQHFWKRFEFWILLLGLTILGGIYLRRKQQKWFSNEIKIKNTEIELQKLRKDQNRLQVKTISSQLNPHFINNALQWLQIRLDTLNDTAAVDMVGKLSENISTVFKNSRNEKSHHSVYSEIKLVENYLYIQKLRFGDRLNFNIDIKANDDLIKKTNIPLMFVQIHVENGIEHGIRNKKDGVGKIDISVRKNETNIIISITDNGVGREKAKAIGSKGTQSGTKILKELQEIFNANNVEKLDQIYQDKVFDSNSENAHGTRVILTVPIEFTYEL